MGSLKYLKQTIILVLILALLTGTLGCSTEKADEGFIVIQDHLGREVKVPKQVDKIVSSYYISTSLLIALGVEDKIVGLEILADKRPLYHKAAPQLIDLPAVGSAKTFNIEQCLSLKPDLVIMPIRMKEYIEQLEKLNITVLAISPEDIDSLSDTIKIIGEAIGVQSRAQELIDYYYMNIAMVEEINKNATFRPKVYLGGSKFLTTSTREMYQHFLINVAGGNNVSSEIEKGYWANISPEQVIEWNPDIVLTVQNAEYSLEDILTGKQWSGINAVKDKKVYKFPSEIEPWDSPMPSAILGILWLTNVIHPDLYPMEKLEEEVSNFYKKFFDIEVSLKEISA